MSLVWRHDDDDSLDQVRRYNTYKSWWFTGTLYVSLITILALAIFETPTVSSLETFAKERFWVTVGLILARF